MSVNDPHLRQTLEFRTAALVARLLPLGLLLIFIGLALYVLADADRHPDNHIGIILSLACGIALTGAALWRRANDGKPIFTLSPEGVRYRVAGVKEFVIPWSEVKGVDTVDINVELPWYVWLFTPLHSYNSFYCCNVTVVLVPKPFYDEAIFVGSFFLRGPGWVYTFIPQGDLVQVALHHELVSVDPAALRAAVEERWLAFRDQPAATTTQIVALGENQRGLSTWQWTQIAVLLVGIGVAVANIAGLWRLPGQTEARLSRLKAREESDHWKKLLIQSERDAREREAQSKKRAREIDEMMKRTFGD